MPRFFLFSLCALSPLAADTPGDVIETAALVFPMLEPVEAPAAEPSQGVEILSTVLPALENALTMPAAAPARPEVTQIPEVRVDPFTGKVKGKKVRMRLKADLDSRVVRELNKGDFLTVVGERGEFWAVEAPGDLDAYIFRSFVLDSVVEGNHVNVRLDPSTDAPIVTRLDAGERIENASVSPINPKWLKISVPQNARFYVAKEYVEYAGGPEVKAQFELKRHTAEQLMESSLALSKAQLRGPFESVDFDKITQGYKSVIEEYAQFPDLVEQSKEALASFQEEYLQMRIAQTEIEPTSPRGIHTATQRPSDALTDKMRIWEPLEEALYQSWASLNDNKSRRDYYEEQQLTATEVCGLIEPYNSPAKNKPGDFIVRQGELPVAYIYSTKVNLQQLVGKQARLIGAPRPNHNFAFPAYYILASD